MYLLSGYSKKCIFACSMWTGLKQQNFIFKFFFIRKQNFSVTYHSRITKSCITMTNKDIKMHNKKGKHSLIIELQE